AVILGFIVDDESGEPVAGAVVSSAPSLGENRRDEEHLNAAKNLNGPLSLALSPSEGEREITTNTLSSGGEREISTYARSDERGFFRIYIPLKGEGKAGTWPASLLVEKGGYKSQERAFLELW